MSKISSTFVDLDITVSGVSRTVEADVQYIHSPAMRGYREKGGGQIDPDEPERAEIQTVLVSGVAMEPNGRPAKFDICHLLTDAQIDAIETEILEQGN